MKLSFDEVSRALAAAREAELMRRGMVSRQRTKGDVALDDPKVCERLGISKSTLMRWREKYAAPQPAYFVGQRGFTWQSDLDAWIDSLPSQNALAGKYQPRSRKHKSTE